MTREAPLTQDDRDDCHRVLGDLKRREPKSHVDAVVGVLLIGLMQRQLTRGYRVIHA